MAEQKRKRRSRAEMQVARDAQKTNGQISEKYKTGQISAKELLTASLPKIEKTKVVYIDKEIPIIKEVRIINDAQGTEKSVTEIIREEIGKIKIWEYKMIPVNEFCVKDLKKLGKEGWRYAFDISPEVSHAFKVTTLFFQRAK